MSFDGAHRRYDPLAGGWVLVSPGRTARPWQGEVVGEPLPERPAHDRACFLCPGNARAGGAQNPTYEGTFVFPNDYAALRPDQAGSVFENGLLRAEPETGECRVLCFSPRHDLDLVDLGPNEMRSVVDLWVDQSEELGRDYPWVQVFENRGAAMGASSPHPHGQVWAGSALPLVGAQEDTSQAGHLTATGRRLLLDYAAQERGGPRVVHESGDWLVVVPFWAVWPFETLLVPLTPAGRLPELTDVARDGLVTALRDLLTRYDALFGAPFPYSMGWHQAPFGEDRPHWQLHAHAYPPMLSSASVRKFQVGYELLSEPQRDFTPEEAAERLRAAR